MIIIGITGTIGAGKGRTVSYLEKKGFVHYSARKFLMQHVFNKKLAPVRENILSVANDLRKVYDSGYIASELLKEAEKNGKDCVIESIRTLGEIDVLRKHGKDFYMLAVDADPKVRYDRIVERKAETDHVTYEKFLEDEAREHNTTDPWAANLGACIAQADYVIKNDAGEEELHKKIDEFIEKIMRK